MSFTWVDYAFWVSETLAFAVSLALILRAGCAFRWWSLTLYCGAQVALNSAEMIMWSRHMWFAYYWTQWPAEIALCAVKLAILWQLILEAITAVDLVPKPISKIFLAAVLLAALGAFLFGSQGVMGVEELPIKALLVNRATNMAAVAVMSTFAIFSSVFALKWRPRALRVDFGLGMISVSDLFCFVAETTFGIRLSLCYRVQSTVHLFAIISWCLAFAMPELEKQPITDKVRMMVRDCVPSKRGEEKEIYENV